MKLIACILGLPLLAAAAQNAEPLQLADRRELFVDDYLIEKLDGVALRLHRPAPQEVAIVHDLPWEGNVSYYHTVFRDGAKYRMYYRGAHANLPSIQATHQVVCYAESLDGIHWSKPALGLHEFAGSKANNIIWTGIGAHNFAPFKDANPDCPAESRYKAIAHGKGGLYIFKSRDGLRWKLMRDTPVITKGAFDSQNLAFYDPTRKRYVDFHRGFNQGVRAIMTCVSDDFVEWTEPEWITYNDDRKTHLYTNQTTPYPRAPHLLLAFPKRFLPARNPNLHRNPGVSDVIFMASRDGRRFHRWNEAFIRPGLQSDRWINRNNFVAWGIVETRSPLPGAPEELSFYSMEGYYQGDSCQMRRYTLRPDGFVSANAPLAGGELLTKPLSFEATRVARKSAPPRQLSDGIAVSRENPVRGNASLAITVPTVLQLSGTQNLGKQATLALAARGVPAGHRRLFSTYDGGGTTPDELYFDVNSAGPISGKDGFSIRFNYNGNLIGAPFTEIGDWSAEKDPVTRRHLAATWDDGEVKLYFDGRLVAAGGTPGLGDLKFRLGGLRFGEDYPPTSLSNEPFLGEIDDLAIIRRALTPEQITELAADSANKTLGTSREKGVLLDFEDRESPLADRLEADGRQPVTGPQERAPGDVELRLNFSTSAAGSIRCEILDDAGKPLPGFSLTDCDALFGDSLDREVRWKGRSELKSLAGRPLRLRFEIKDADLFALRFGADEAP